MGCKSIEVKKFHVENNWLSLVETNLVCFLRGFTVYIQRGSFAMVWYLAFI